MAPTVENLPLSNLGHHEPVLESRPDQRDRDLQGGGMVAVGEMNDEDRAVGHCEGAQRLQPAQARGLARLHPGAG